MNSSTPPNKDRPHPIQIVAAGEHRFGVTVKRMLGNIKESHVEACSLEQVESCARRIGADLIVMHLHSLQGRALDHCQRLKLDPDLNLIPLLIVTSTKTASAHLKAFQQGAHDILTAPLHGKLLEAHVQALRNYRNSIFELVRARAEQESRTSEHTLELSRINDQLREEILAHTKAQQSWAEKEEQLRHAHKMEAVGRLAGGIAHDFNNLLMVISGHSEILRLKLGNDHDLLKNAKAITEASHRAATLTRQLLAFGRQQTMEMRSVNLNDLIRHNSQTLQQYLGSGILLTNRPAQGLGEVMIDPEQFRQVLFCLIANAREALPQGGQVTLETANITLDVAYSQRHEMVTPGEYVMVTVSDNGLGMDKNTQTRIFEPFFTTKGVGEGPGLGLSMAYGIIKQSHGHALVHSEKGKGTCFKIYLPRATSRKTIPIESHVSVSNPGQKFEILVAEDEDPVREMIVQTLNGLGFKVWSARDGVEAEELGIRHLKSIDLLVTDMIMPRRDGNELAQRLKARRPDLKVLFVSGYSEGAVFGHGMLEKGSAFLSKPFSPHVLAQKIDEILHTSSTADHASEKKDRNQHQRLS